VHVIHQRGEGHQVEQQRAGNVVGQVADDLQSPRALQGAEVELQRIALVDRQPFGREALPQARDQVAVDLDHMQVGQPFEQRFGERAQAWADFDHGVAVARRDGVDDLADDAVGHQEVLAKTAPRHMTHHFGAVSEKAKPRSGLSEPCERP
jgi:hypothetical protein